MIFNYDKNNNSLGGNKQNLKKAFGDVKDFFTKKQDIIKPYKLNSDEKNFFARMKNELSE